MNSEQVQEVAFNIILHSGNGKTMIHEAFGLMRDKKYEDATNKLEEAEDALVEAHKSQTSLLQKYAGGTEVPVDMIMVHAQDHLMTTMTMRELALEFMELYKRNDH